jgi:hypothetical protein
MDVTAPAPMQTCLDAERDLEREDIHLLDQDKHHPNLRALLVDGFQIPTLCASGYLRFRPAGYDGGGARGPGLRRLAMRSPRQGVEDATAASAVCGGRHAGADDRWAPDGEGWASPSRAQTSGGTKMSARYSCPTATAAPGARSPCLGAARVRVATATTSGSAESRLPAPGRRDVQGQDRRCALAWMSQAACSRGGPAWD